MKLWKFQDNRQNWKILTEVAQTQKNKYHMFSFICVYTHTHMYLENTYKHIHIYHEIKEDKRAAMLFYALCEDLGWTLDIGCIDIKLEWKSCGFRL